MGSKKKQIFKIKRKTPSIFFVIFIISIIFFIGSISITSFYVFFNNQNQISNQLEITIGGPSKIRSGDVLNYIIKLENITKKKIYDVNFLIRYPESSYHSAKQEDLYIDSLVENKNILAGGTLSQKFSSILSGSVKQIKEINIEISYKIEGFSNILTKKIYYKIEIGSSFIEIDANIPEKIISNNPFDIKIKIKLTDSNKSIPENLILSVNFPKGLEILKSSEKPLFSSQNKSTFLIKDLSLIKQKEITISAILAGQDNENKFFSFLIGDSIKNLEKIKSVFAKSEHEITINKSDLDLILTTGDGYYKNKNIFLAGETVNVNFNLNNNLINDIFNLKLTAILPDNFIHMKKVKTKNSFYDSNNNKIIWDKNINEKFKKLDSKTGLNDKFSFKLKETKDIAGYFVDPEFKIKFDLENLKPTNSGKNYKSTKSFEKKIKIGTNVSLVVGLVENKGPFKKYGSFYPKVGEKSSYTIFWKVYNSSSDITNITIKTKLPHYVKFLNNISPKNSYVSYYEDTREVILRFKKIEAGIGYNTDPKTVYFQVEYIPTFEHLNNKVYLTHDSFLSAYEKFTERDINLINDEKVKIYIPNKDN